MGDDREALREANDLFYRALEGLDLGLMDRVWFQEGPVRCIHPGWETISGWPSVRKSWEQIFANTGWIRVAPSSVELEILGDVGIVTCSENITAASEADVGVAVAQATNVFKRVPEGWRMILHHASPSPIDVTRPSTTWMQ